MTEIEYFIAFKIWSGQHWNTSAHSSKFAVTALLP
ncbi:hypothetical protein T09_5586 [Trichinella sp. T9]|nr:hypothetical protein T09_5586 [Trichinella sp. T9]